MTTEPRPALETLTQLAQVSETIARLEAERDRLVVEARSEAVTWQAISEALGVSRQAAWKAHQAGARTVTSVRDRSELTEAAAMRLAKDALREVRVERGNAPG